MRRAATIFCLLMCFVVEAHSELVVIVHPQTNLDEISDRQLAMIFLSKTKYLPNGTRARPVEISSMTTKNHFYSRVAGKQEVELRKYWATVIFSGKGQPPKQFKSAASVLRYVASKPGAIAYIPRDSISPSVKVVKTIK
ncbi:MAG: substrate-binding domain-containing protein [Candidatus Thiodiazotropha sp. (ex Ctena orbiculata)]|uniref:Substrate-binding domain-containing protein n=1 Tax=Candidatus Thiodiazotropha taylori TaxID=2792791 RepID=A0A944MAQ2_9GAMM|nr:substrate-binding domain-containing protein [Candidatus Thiodiazotropha taylori]PUB88888.1 MAG: phosphate ABC transporter substrate-binding protein [gamma proteobacterium symbiont of Ctena orbiculata]MBT2990403.1 substrate-binding domain-containing protein [Candidatus Thiodiazotropha taylori]MBT2998056.1 substrate-binding domain-containing protein [Candidatus Thiodiazotropha taylori]MBT3002267.1 substrate-binding domain-containing protein [Candidatus Thiodiazotropha taylori]